MTDREEREMHELAARLDLSLKATVKTGTREGFVSSYTIFFSNGLRRKTEDLTWSTTDQQIATRAQFIEVLGVLQQAGVHIEGDIP